MAAKSKLLIFLTLCCLSSFGLQAPAWSQIIPGEEIPVDDDDLSIGGDIFNDYNEDLEDEKVTEDERFYRYGRFFSFNMALGLTTFDGNRGRAYRNDHPSYGLGVNYFIDFFSSVGMGFEFSRHHFIIDGPTFNFSDDEFGPGYVDVSMLRVYLSYRFYIDTSDLGTAITYANPYFTARMEYWYTQNKFRDRKDTADDAGGGLGMGLGGGLEFPMKIKESYIGVEFLYHRVNFHDKYTRAYQPAPGKEQPITYQDFTGSAYSTMISYVISW